MPRVDALTAAIQPLKRPGDFPIAELASKQYGVVAIWQLKAMGYSMGAIKQRVATGRLHRIHRSVYALGHSKLTPRGRLMAGALACGPAAVLSHRSAAGLWDLRPAPSGAIDVTVPGRTRHSREGSHVHNVRTLHPEDRTTRDGIPVTSIHRTLLDYAEVARKQQLRLAIEASERQDLFNGFALEALIARSPGRHGTKPLMAVLAEITGPAPWTRSELERRFLALIRAAGIPEPQANVIVEGYEVDFFWPRQRVVAELDSWGFHKTRSSFYGDRRRDTKLQLARIAVVRITQPRVEFEPDELVSDLKRLLGAWAAGH